MNIRSFRTAAFAGLAIAGGVTACSKDDPPPVAYVSAYLQPSDDNPTACNLSRQPILKVGDTGAANDPPTTEADGQSGLSVQCSVVPNGSGFHIRLSARTGTGSFALSGNVDANGGTGLFGSFLNPTAGVGTYQSQKGCSVTFKSAESGMDIPEGQRLSAGSIWAHVECPDAESQTGVQTDNGVATCDGTADFLFQNCTSE